MFRWHAIIFLIWGTGPHMHVASFHSDSALQTREEIGLIN